ncbi:extensin family protein [Salinarimonas sp.]|uniref:extensin-like domain-containing protein n=1 Tax=Salinarimonas sp. TaxID=2766526 RepID=UPI0032D8B637
MRGALPLAALAALAGVPALAQQEAPPRPPERPPGLSHIEMDPPIPMTRPVFPDDPEGLEEIESPALDARTETTPGPPPRPAPDEPEAVLPDEERAPLEVTQAEREAHRACLADLDRLDVAYEAREAIDGEGDCGAAFPLRVTAIGDVALEPAITVRCPVARALAGWLDESVIPAADAHLDAEIATVFTAGAYVCRGRNRQEGARLSEHAFANAVDITGVDFVARTAVPVEPRDGRETPEARFQREIRAEACAHFRTVLGPGSDAYHDDHLHFDQRERTNDYRLCE